MRQFEDRTAAGDLEWVNQALALGFSSLTEIRPNSPWVLVAAETDRSQARVAQRLVQDLVQRTLPEPEQQDELGHVLAASMGVAIEHGNAPFLGLLEPIVESLPDVTREAFTRHLQGVYRLTNYRELLWARLITAAGSSPKGDRDPDAWTWVRSIPGYDPSIWTDSSLELRKTLATRLHATFEVATIVRTQRFLEQLGVEPFVGDEPDLINAAMSPWRKLAPLDRWVLTNDKRFTRTQELKALIEILNWAARRNTPTQTLAGNDLVSEASQWAQQLAQRSDELARYAQPLRQAVVHWETAALHGAVVTNPDERSAPPRPRVRL